MNITIDMVTGEIVNDDNVIVISGNRTSDKPEKLEHSDFSGHSPEVQIREIEFESETQLPMPLDISDRDIDSFLNDMN
jgi:hypothetical protein